MLSAHLEAVAQKWLMPADWRVDFTQPAGEPALVPAGSVSWRVFANPVTLFIGGVAAVILELAEPRVRAGVWNHTSFRADPVTRLRRTGLAAMVTVYGARSVAEAMIAGINRRHDRVRGITPDGEPYHAADPELLTWVQATAAFGFLEAYATYVAPLDRAERDVFYAEGREAARLYGAVDAPASQDAFDTLLATMRPQLKPSATLDEFLSIMRTALIVPAPLRPFQHVLVTAAIDLVPAGLRRELQLEAKWRVGGRRLVAKLCQLSDRIKLPGSPSEAAARRLKDPPKQA